MGTNFQDILGQNAGDAKPPPLIPIGTYQAVILGHEFLTSSKKHTPFCRFNLRITGVGEDVDEGEVEEFGGLQALSERKPHLDQYMTEKTLHMLTEFLRDVCELEVDKRTYDVIIPETQGLDIQIFIIHRTIEGTNRTFAEVDRAFPV